MYLSYLAFVNVDTFLNENVKDVKQIFICAWNEPKWDFKILKYLLISLPLQFHLVQNLHGIGIEMYQVCSNNHHALHTSLESPRIHWYHGMCYEKRKFLDEQCLSLFQAYVIFGFAQKILKVIYLLSVWSRTYPGLHPHWTWPSELIQTCSHPPFSFLHSSAVKSEKWISKKECVFFTIILVLFDTA